MFRLQDCHENTACKIKEFGKTYSKLSKQELQILAAEIVLERNGDQLLGEAAYNVDCSRIVNNSIKRVDGHMYVGYLLELLTNPNEAIKAKIIDHLIFSAKTEITERIKLLVDEIMGEEVADNDEAFEELRGNPAYDDITLWRKSA